MFSGYSVYPLTSQSPEVHSSGIGRTPSSDAEWDSLPALVAADIS